MTYDDENIFAKILKGDIPCESVFEDEHVLSLKI
jgi:diadenosine tetraphosphate (Ap4A) HIT family hydrolase